MHLQSSPLEGFFLNKYVCLCHLSIYLLEKKPPSPPSHLSARVHPPLVWFFFFPFFMGVPPKHLALHLYLAHQCCVRSWCPTWGQNQSAFLFASTLVFNISAEPLSYLVLHPPLVTNIRAEPPGTSLLQWSNVS